MKELAILIDNDDVSRMEVFIESLNSRSIRIVAEIINFEEALSVLETFRPDVVLIGAVSKSRKAVDGMRQFLTNLGSTPIVCYGRRVEGKSKQVDGFDGVVFMSRERLLYLVRNHFSFEGLLRGSELIIESMEGPEIDSKLTDRQKELLKYIAMGKRNPEIAGLLGVPTRTIAVYVYKIKCKVGLNNRAELIQYGSRLLG